MSELIVVESKVAQWNRQKERMMAEFSAHDEMGQRLEKEIRERIEDGKELLVRFAEGEYAGSDRAVGVVPNRWHIIRKGRGDNELDHYLPILGPNGEYRPPESAVVDHMQKIDLGKPGALNALFKERERQERNKEAEIALKKEQRIDEFAQAYAAARRTKGESALKHFKNLKAPE